MAQKREAPGSGFKPQPRAGPYPELRGQGTVSQQSQVLPELAVRLGGLNGQHLHAHARLGGHCGEECAASGGGRPTGARPSPGPEAGTAPLTLGLQAAEQAPQLALSGQALAVADMLHTDVQAAWVWGQRRGKLGDCRSPRLPLNPQEAGGPICPTTGLQARRPNSQAPGQMRGPQTVAGRADQGGSWTVPAAADEPLGEMSAAHLCTGTAAAPRRPRG